LIHREVIHGLYDNVDNPIEFDLIPVSWEKWQKNMVNFSRFWQQKRNIKQCVHGPFPYQTTLHGTNSISPDTGQSGSPSNSLLHLVQMFGCQPSRGSTSTYSVPLLS
jgi:hypothetical protein